MDNVIENNVLNALPRNGFEDLVMRSIVANGVQLSASDIAKYAMNPRNETVIRVKEMGAALAEFAKLFNALLEMYNTTVCDGEDVVLPFVTMTDRGEFKRGEHGGVGYSDTLSIKTIIMRLESYAYTMQVSCHQGKNSDIILKTATGMCAYNLRNKAHVCIMKEVVRRILGSVQTPSKFIVSNPGTFIGILNRTSDFSRTIELIAKSMINYIRCQHTDDGDDDDDTSNNDLSIILVPSPPMKHIQDPGVIYTKEVKQKYTIHDTIQAFSSDSPTEKRYTIVPYSTDTDTRISPFAVRSTLASIQSLPTPDVSSIDKRVYKFTGKDEMEVHKIDIGTIYDEYLKCDGFISQLAKLFVEPTFDKNQIKVSNIADALLNKNSNAYDVFTKKIHEANSFNVSDATKITTETDVFVKDGDMYKFGENTTTNYIIKSMLKTGHFISSVQVLTFSYVHGYPVIGWKHKPIVLVRGNDTTGDERTNATGTVFQFAASFGADVHIRQGTAVCPDTLFVHDRTVCNINENSTLEDIDSKAQSRVALAFHSFYDNDVDYVGIDQNNRVPTSTSINMEFLSIDEYVTTFNKSGTCVVNVRLSLDGYSATPNTPGTSDTTTLKFYTVVSNKITESGDVTTTHPFNPYISSFTLEPCVEQVVKRECDTPR